jgi:urease accessory protein
VKAIALVRLLQLSSQSLPVGGYSHSHGLESAIEHQLVMDEASVARWISDVLEFSMHSFEIPWLLSLLAAWAASDPAAVALLNDEFLAARESAELRAAAVQMGFSLRALLCVLPDVPPSTVETLRTMPEPSLPCVWSAAATAWRIEARDAVTAYLWAWAENQVIVALKAVPLGQSAGQRVLLAMGSKIAALAENVGLVGAAGDPAVVGTAGVPCSNFSPGLAILSSQHETQYSRLFRS